ncbi:MAG: hypothetical protein LCH69_13445 [Proteobacteria bacterium]|nr:hypothetical protein [Pseudomonadota bacterium]
MTYIAIATLAAALVTAAPAAMANSWAWAPVSNGATLDAHLARADFARPNVLPVFAMIEEIAAPEAAY